ncbi:hypothetical protein [Vibrio quintilis]|uniref:hypothetical protein n=1 Tax=Vibrio quintilis TaxID=1117707 RepID=UPI0013563CF4|nr:hypothetical protein [Vibrio quintilis]
MIQPSPARPHPAFFITNGSTGSDFNGILKGQANFERTGTGTAQYAGPVAARHIAVD